MPDINHTRTIAAPPQTIWPLLATAAGLESWWTIGKTKVAGDPVGPDGFRFESGSVVTELVAETCEPGSKLCWLCTGSNAPGGWIDTRIIFDLSPIAGGAKLDFAHRGFAEDDDGYRRVTAGWSQYLDQLRTVAEA